MAEFSKLWDLRIRVHNILNFHPSDRDQVISLTNILPRSLKWLHLSDCREDLCDMLVTNLEGLLTHRKEKFPSLEQLLIYPAAVEGISRTALPGTSGPQVRIPPAFRARFESVQELCREGGIEFDFVLRGSYMISIARSMPHRSY
ncbi:hypothetical protein P175DRAFT_0553283 [Aspergillus ochraceoroseus IBT 24754]|nr:uncharacterized protein P175DRAFT_0553283 [Aspergillus ochraceoroseus IBT 24754]PTU23991.1 hypothetical protein P175DRAFT_0553283 [Aspergillus ochraceoroseus IBT 24754]